MIDNIEMNDKIRDQSSVSDIWGSVLKKKMKRFLFETMNFFFLHKQLL